MTTKYSYFIKANVEEHIGNWIAVHNDKIIASNHSAKKVIEEAKKLYPRSRPFITKVPEKATMIF